MSDSGARVGVAVPQELVSTVNRKITISKCLRMAELNYMQFMLNRVYRNTPPRWGILCGVELKCVQQVMVREPFRRGGKYANAGA